MANRFSIVRLLLIVAVVGALAAPLPNPVFDIASPAWAQKSKNDKGDKGSKGGGKGSKDGGQDPADGGQDPADGGQDPADGGQDPADGGQDPGDGGQDPADGGQDPGDGSAEQPDAGAPLEDGGAVAVSSPPAENDEDHRRGLNFFAGLDAYKEGDYDIATKHWLPLAEYGHARSQAGLGAVYYNSALFADAFRWSQAAARQGDRDAAHNLAVLYQYGLGTPFRMSRAMFWYGEAASDGHRKAILALRELRGEPLAAYLVPVPIPKPGGPERLADSRLTEEAQILLATLGYDPGPIDGRYGEQTKAAVEQFERDRGLFIRGRADETLLTNLRRAIVDESVTTISSSSAG